MQVRFDARALYPVRAQPVTSEFIRTTIPTGAARRWAAALL